MHSPLFTCHFYILTFVREEIIDDGTDFANGVIGHGTDFAHEVLTGIDNLADDLVSGW